jgi:hypothetical protein
VLSGSGVDVTNVLSAAAAIGTANAPTATTPQHTARARRTKLGGEKVLFMLVAQR